MLLLLSCAPELEVVDGSNTVQVEGVDELLCTLRSDPREVHRAQLDDDGRSTMHGLLADELYDCDAEGLIFEVDTLPLPDWVPEVTTFGDPDESVGAYTLFQHFVQEPGQGLTQQALLIVDREGEIRWYHRLTHDVGVTDASYLGDGVVLHGGRNGSPGMVDLSGSQLWTWDITGQHHDIEMLPSGHVAALVYEQHSDYLGFGVKIVDPNTDEVVYEIADDELDLRLPSDADSSRDAFHANALSVEERGDELIRIWVNLAHTSRLIRIEPRERVIDLEVGDGSDWTITGDWWEAPHDPQFDGDRVLFYDNGNADRGTRIQEVLLEEEDLQAATTWTWTPGWFEPVWGGVARLGEDRVLVTRGHCLTCTDEGQSTLYEVDREGRVVWRLELDVNSGLYRAQPIEGCDIFQNSRFCAD